MWIFFFHQNFDSVFLMFHVKWNLKRCQKTFHIPLYLNSMIFLSHCMDFIFTICDNMWQQKTYFLKIEFIWIIYSLPLFQIIFLLQTPEEGLKNQYSTAGCCLRNTVCTFLKLHEHAKSVLSSFLLFAASSFTCIKNNLCYFLTFSQFCQSSFSTGHLACQFMNARTHTAFHASGHLNQAKCPH